MVWINWTLESDWTIVLLMTDLNQWSVLCMTISLRWILPFQRYETWSSYVRCAAWGAPTSSDFRARPFEWSSIICYSATLVLFIHLHVGTRTGTFWNKSHWSDPSWAIMIHHEQSDQSWSIRSVMINHDRPWSIVIDHDQSWSIMINRDRPWSIVIHHEPSWSIMSHRDRAWAIMIHQEPSWSIKSHHDPSRAIMIHQEQSWSTMINRDRPWSIVIEHGQSWSNMIVLDGSWWIMIVLDGSWSCMSNQPWSIMISHNSLGAIATRWAPFQHSA